jgi:lysophospholipase L1-like esterase
MLERRHRRALTSLATAGAAAVALVGLLAGVAQAAPHHPQPAPGSAYVALGSSYAAGGGITATETSGVGALCGRSTLNYAHLVASTLDLDLTDASCGGATTAHLTTAQQVFDRTTGRLVAVAPQVDSVGPQTELVTLTIGGNDVRYATALTAQACLGDLAINPTSPVSNGLKPFGICTPPSDETVATALAGLEDSMVAAIQAVQARAPQARILVVDYLTVLPENGKPCAVAPIPQAEQKALLSVARSLNLATKHAAQRTDVELVAASALGRGHDVCSRDPWVTGYDFSRILNLMHPNEAGHAAVAEAVVRELTAPGAR